MRIRTRRALAVLVTSVLALTACGGGGSSTPTESATGGDGGEKLLSVANIVNGTLGDQGFFDDAERGIQELAKAGHKTTTLQADANNPSQWKANLERGQLGGAFTVTGDVSALTIRSDPSS